MFQRRLAVVVAALSLSGAASAQQQVLRDVVPGTGVWNTIADGGFEAGTMTGWGGASFFFSATDAESFAGDFSAVTMTPFASSGPGYGATSAPIAVTPGETYILSGAMHADGIIAGAIYIDMNDISGEASLVACTGPGITGWQFGWARWTADRSSITIRIVRDGTREISDAGYFDEIALTPEADFVPPESTYSCYADCDASACPGQLDFFDFLCFQNAFASGEPYADCDDSGALDFFDFLCYQNAFSFGCP